jgi:hypothetical protein
MGPDDLSRSLAHLQGVPGLSHQRSFAAQTYPSPKNVEAGNREQNEDQNVHCHSDGLLAAKNHIP